MTPGAVVFRSPVLELIQYAPQTERVRSIPLLSVPPTISKFYVTDLAPGRSLIEYLVQAGQQVFAISWRNPRVDGAAWGMDTYGEAILDALGAIDKIWEIDRTLLLAACSGGIITSMLLGHLCPWQDCYQSTQLLGGVNRVRFPAPVPVGSRIRGHVRLVSAEQKQAGLECAFGVLVELEGSESAGLRDRDGCDLPVVPPIAKRRSNYQGSAV